MFDKREKMVKNDPLWTKAKKKKSIFIILVHHNIASQTLKLAKVFCVACVGFFE